VAAQRIWMDAWASGSRLPLPMPARLLMPTPLALPTLLLLPTPTTMLLRALIGTASGCPERCPGCPGCPELSRLSRLLPCG